MRGDAVPQAWGRLVTGLLAACLLVGPAAALDPERSIRQYKHTRWTVAEGAPPVIYVLVQGRDGYLWIGSAAGLYRFDGITFEHIPLRVPNARGWRATSVLAAQDGSIWVGYNSGKLAVYRDGHLQLDRSFPPAESAVSWLTQTKDGAVWAVIQQRGNWLRRYVNGEWEEIGPHWGLSMQQSSDVFAARDGALWAATEEKILVLRPGSTHFEHVGNYTGQAAITDDASGRVWVTDSHGSRTISNSRRSITLFTGALETAAPIVTRFDRDGNFWAVTGKGVTRVQLPDQVSVPGRRPEVTELEHFGASDGLTADITTAVLEDREGNIWIGTTLGLDQFRNARIVREPQLATIPRSGFSLLGASDGTIYVSASRGLFSVAPRGEPQRLAAPFESTLICEDADHGIWAFSQNHALRIQRGVASRAEARAVLEALRSNHNLDGCATDGDGTLWVNGTEAGLFSYAEGQWRHYPPSSDQWAMTLTPGLGGRPLVWLRSGKLVRIDRDGRPQPPLLVRRAADMHFVHQGRSDIFVGGPFGIGRVRSGKLEIAEADRFPWLVDPYAMVETPEGQTWILGLAGIVGIATAELDRAFRDPQVRPRVTVLSFDDGLPNLRSVLRRAVARGGDGRLWVATLGGVVWVDPAQLYPNAAPPPVHIGSLVANGVNYRDPVRIELPQGTSSLAIHYAGLSLTIPHRVRFRYMLEGVNTEWVDAGTRRDAFFTNLGPGTYRFRVIAANNDGVWNRQGDTLEFTIHPTFLQTIWFKLLIALVVVALSTLAYRFRMRQVMARMQSRFDIRIAERERIARELHDTLLQGIQGLMLRFQAAANRVSTPEIRETLDDALERADAVLVEGRARVRDLRSTSESGELAQRLLDLASRLVDGEAPRVDLAVEGKPRALHPLVQEEALRIAEEAIRNVVNHAGATKLDMRLTYGRNEFVLRVRDNGAGIPEATLSAGSRTGHFGLVGMRERAQQIGGRLHMASSEGAGTEVALLVPARAAYSDRRLRLLKWLPLARLGGRGQ